MPRSPEAGTPRTERISVRTTEDEAADLDEIRGAQSRSDFVRGLVHAAVVAFRNARSS